MLSEGESFCLEMEDLYSKKEQIEQEYYRTRNSILAPVQEDLDALDAEFKPMLESMDRTLAELEAGIRWEARKTQKTIIGRRFKFLYQKPRISWDTTALDEYAEIHPEILKFRKEGDPIVTFRKS